MLRFRLISGTLLVLAVILLARFSTPEFLFVVCCALGLLALWESFRLISLSGQKVWKKTGLLAGAGLIIGTWGVRQGAISYGDLFFYMTMTLLIVCFVGQIFLQETGGAAQRLAMTLFGYLYGAGMFFFIMLLLFESAPGDGRWLVIYMVLVVKCSDIGAYTFGRLFGRHKMIPAISPKKTWEGFFGGIFFSVLAGVLFVHFHGNQFSTVTLRPLETILLPVLLALAGIVGDLMESLIKRSFEIKDSGDYIKGMGGILDVLDSLLLGAPVLYFYLKTIELLTL